MKDDIEIRRFLKTSLFVPVFQNAVIFFCLKPVEIEIVSKKKLKGGTEIQIVFLDPFFTMK